MAYNCLISSDRWHIYLLLRCNIIITNTFWSHFILRLNYSYYHTVNYDISLNKILIYCLLINSKVLGLGMEIMVMQNMCFINTSKWPMC